MTKENAAELGKYFIHRYPEAGGIYDAINIPLERAAAIAELMEIAGCHREQNEVNIYRAAEALRLEILDAQVLLEYHLDLMKNVEGSAEYRLNNPEKQDT